MSTRRMAIVVLVASLLPHAASAAGGPSLVVSVRPSRIDVKAAPGYDNVLLITETGTTVTFRDASGEVALVQPAPQCSAAGGLVTCEKPAVLRIKLGDGDDTLVNLTSVRVVAKGGSGDDSLFGGSGDDDLRGDSGNDDLHGGAGADELRGGTGDDVLEGGDGPDVSNGQGGVDTVWYRDPTVWPVVTRDRKNDDGVPGEGDNVLLSVENVDVHPFNYRADDAVLPPGGTLPVAAEVWPAAGEFDLETRREAGIQVLAYYDGDGKMRVAARRFGETAWVQTPPLPTLYVKTWDQHRSIELAFDPDGRLHVIGNMHGLSIGQTDLIEVCCSPLQYFRTPDPVDDPADVLTLVRSTMVSPNVDVPLPFEDVTTYPEFFSDGERFFFIYRDGFSNGAEWYVHELNRTTGQWFNPNGNQPWYSGVQGAAPPPSGQLNPQTTGFYFDFGFHGAGFWIAGYDAWLYPASCSADSVDGRCSLSWITSTDFDHFRDAAGAELQTPILPTTRSAAALVDPAPYGGLWGIAAAFDEQGHPMLVYGRHAASRLNGEGVLEGNYQAYFARWNGSQWQRVQLSSWSQWTTFSPSLGVIPAIAGPIVDAGGVSHWYVLMTAVDEPPNTRTTGWLEIDLDTLATTPAPSFQPSTTKCKTGNTAVVPPPVADPEWIEPQNQIVLTPRTRRSNLRPPGLGEEASGYYYLSWNMTSAEPVPSSVPGAPPLVDPPLVPLNLRRTTCVK